MNLNLSIYRMAFREAPSLGEAQLLVAKKHADLERQLLLDQVNEGRAPSNRVIENTVASMEMVSDQRLQARHPHRVDRRA